MILFVQNVQNLTYVPSKAQAQAIAQATGDFSSDDFSIAAANLATVLAALGLNADGSPISGDGTSTASTGMGSGQVIGDQVPGGTAGAQGGAVPIASATAAGATVGGLENEEVYETSTFGGVPVGADTKMYGMQGSGDYKGLDEANGFAKDWGKEDWTADEMSPMGGEKPGAVQVPDTGTIDDLDLPDGDDGTTDDDEEGGGDEGGDDDTWTGDDAPGDEGQGDTLIFVFDDEYEPIPDTTTTTYEDNTIDIDEPQEYTTSNYSLGPGGNLAGRLEIIASLDFEPMNSEPHLIGAAGGRVYKSGVSKLYTISSLLNYRVCQAYMFFLNNYLAWDILKKKKITALAGSGHAQSFNATGLSLRKTYSKSRTRLWDTISHLKMFQFNIFMHEDSLNFGRAALFTDASTFHSANSILDTLWATDASAAIAGFHIGHFPKSNEVPTYKWETWWTLKAEFGGDNEYTYNIDSPDHVPINRASTAIYLQMVSDVITGIRDFSPPFWQGGVSSTETTQDIGWREAFVANPFHIVRGTGGDHLSFFRSAYASQTLGKEGIGISWNDPDHTTGIPQLNATSEDLEARDVRHWRGWRAFQDSWKHTDDLGAQGALDVDVIMIMCKRLSRELSLSATRNIAWHGAFDWPPFTGGTTADFNTDAETREHIRRTYATGNLIKLLAGEVSVQGTTPTAYSLRWSPLAKNDEPGWMYTCTGPTVWDPIMTTDKPGSGIETSLRFPLSAFAHITNAAPGVSLLAGGLPATNASVYVTPDNASWGGVVLPFESMSIAMDEGSVYSGPSFFTDSWCAPPPNRAMLEDGRFQSFVMHMEDSFMFAIPRLLHAIDEYPFNVADHFPAAFKSAVSPPELAAPGVAGIDHPSYPYFPGCIRPVTIYQRFLEHVNEHLIMPLITDETMSYGSNQATFTEDVTDAPAVQVSWMHSTAPIWALTENGGQAGSLSQYFADTIPGTGGGELEDGRLKIGAITAAEQKETLWKMLAQIIVFKLAAGAEMGEAYDRAWNLKMLLWELFCLYRDKKVIQGKASATPPFWVLHPEARPTESLFGPHQATVYSNPVAGTWGDIIMGPAGDADINTGRGDFMGNTAGFFGDLDNASGWPSLGPGMPQGVTGWGLELDVDAFQMRGFVPNVYTGISGPEDIDLAEDPALIDRLADNIIRRMTLYFRTKNVDPPPLYEIDFIFANYWKVLSPDQWGYGPDVNLYGFAEEIDPHNDGPGVTDPAYAHNGWADGGHPGSYSPGWTKFTPGPSPVHFNSWSGTLFMQSYYVIDDWDYTSFYSYVWRPSYSFDWYRFSDWAVVRNLKDAWYDRTWVHNQHEPPHFSAEVTSGDDTPWKGVPNGIGSSIGVNWSSITGAISEGTGTQGNIFATMWKFYESLIESTWKKSTCASAYNVDHTTHTNDNFKTTGEGDPDLKNSYVTLGPSRLFGDRQHSESADTDAWRPRLTRESGMSEDSLLIMVFEMFFKYMCRLSGSISKGYMDYDGAVAMSVSGSPTGPSQHGDAVTLFDKMFGGLEAKTQQISSLHVEGEQTASWFQSNMPEQHFDYVNDEGSAHPGAGPAHQNHWYDAWDLYESIQVPMNPFASNLFPHQKRKASVETLDGNLAIISKSPVQQASFVDWTIRWNMEAMRQLYIFNRVLARSTIPTHIVNGAIEFGDPGLGEYDAAEMTHGLFVDALDHAMAPMTHTAAGVADRHHR